MSRPVVSMVSLQGVLTLGGMIAQWVEQSSSNPSVSGSVPSLTRIYAETTYRHRYVQFGSSPTTISPMGPIKYQLLYIILCTVVCRWRQKVTEKSSLHVLLSGVTEDIKQQNSILNLQIDHLKIKLGNSQDLQDKYTLYKLNYINMWKYMHALHITLQTQISLKTKCLRRKRKTDQKQPRT